VSWHIRERIDVYLNGTDGAKELTINMLTMWQHLFPACGLFAEALVELIKAVLRVVIVVLMPLLFWIAPVISVFTAHRMLSDAEVRQRMRADIHRNGSETS
jgi:hypothetical protein